jgi:hypothetical protein
MRRAGYNTNPKSEALGSSTLLDGHPSAVSPNTLEICFLRVREQETRLVSHILAIGRISLPDPEQFRAFKKLILDYFHKVHLINLRDLSGAGSFFYRSKGGIGNV